MFRVPLIVRGAPIETNGGEPQVGTVTVGVQPGAGNEVLVQLLVDTDCASPPLNPPT
jgi:hypothetical protein